MSDYADQSGYAVRCGWGPVGLAHLLPGAGAVVIVDVLSFTTCVEVAVTRGAEVFPYAWRDDTSREFAASRGARLAGPRGEPGPTLSPSSLLEVESGTRIVLPSPNGSTLSLAAGDVPTFAACLRNAPAVARALADGSSHVAVIAAGERWPDGTLRPAIEDWLGAGAVVAHLEGDGSPEATSAAEAFRAAAPDLRDRVLACASGRELRERGYEQDVEIASALGVSDTVPRLAQGAYVKETPRG